MKLIKKLLPVTLIAVFGSTAQLQPVNFDEYLPEVGTELQDTAKAAPQPTITPTPSPISTPAAMKQPKPSHPPTPKPKPPKESEDAPPGYIYVNGFGYVKTGGPNQVIPVDSKGDVSKIVGYMGDEPEPTPTPEEVYIPKNGDREINIYTGETKIYVEGQGFILMVDD